MFASQRTEVAVPSINQLGQKLRRLPHLPSPRWTLLPSYYHYGDVQPSCNAYTQYDCVARLCTSVHKDNRQRLPMWVTVKCERWSRLVLAALAGGTHVGSLHHSPLAFHWHIIPTHLGSPLISSLQISSPRGDQIDSLLPEPFCSPFLASSPLS